MFHFIKLLSSKTFIWKGKWWATGEQYSSCFKIRKWSFIPFEANSHIKGLKLRCYFYTKRVKIENLVGDVCMKEWRKGKDALTYFLSDDVEHDKVMNHILWYNERDHCICTILIKQLFQLFFFATDMWLSNRYISYICWP